MLYTEVPEKLFPKPGLALYASQGLVADTQQQAEGYFSFKFTGDSLTQTSMPFATFKGLVDDCYSSVKKLFLKPVVEAGGTRSYFEFGVLQPCFSSLVIALEAPSVFVPRSYSKFGFDAHGALQGFDKTRSHFFEEMTTIADQVHRGKMSERLVLDHFTTLNHIDRVLPGKNNDIESVEFRSTDQNFNARLKIGKKAGSEIREVRRSVERRGKLIGGVIIEVNGKSSTFVVRSWESREVTCSLTGRAFSEIEFALGASIDLQGQYLQRTRRDLLTVSRYRFPQETMNWKDVF